MSVTTVPLRPVSKGGLWLLWIGVAALLAIAAGVAWSQTRVNGFEVVKAGEGPSPTDEDIVLIKYTGRLSDGTVFDQQEKAPLPVAGSVPGFSKALKKMQRGGRSEERRVGTECVSTCRSRWWPDALQKNHCVDNLPHTRQYHLISSIHPDNLKKY